VLLFVKMMASLEDSMDAIKSARFRYYWKSLNESELIEDRHELTMSWNFLSAMQLLNRELNETHKNTPKNNKKKILICDMQRSLMDVYMKHIEKTDEMAASMSMNVAEEEDLDVDAIIGLLVGKDAWYVLFLF
jgi:predicted alpha-1,6-mannanase (GH76 family)